MATATSQYRALLQLVTDEALAMRRLKAAALAGQELPTDPVTSCTHPEAEQGAARVPGPSLLDALPLDLLIEIAVHLGNVTDLLSFLKTSKRMWSLSRAPELLAPWTWRHRHALPAPVLRRALDLQSCPASFVSRLKAVIAQEHGGDARAALWGFGSSKADTTTSSSTCSHAANLDTYPILSRHHSTFTPVSLHSSSASSCTPAPQPLLDYMLNHAAKSGDIATLRWALCLPDSAPTSQLLSSPSDALNNSAGLAKLAGASDDSRSSSGGGAAAGTSGASFETQSAGRSSSSSAGGADTDSTLRLSVDGASDISSGSTHVPSYQQQQQRGGLHGLPAYRLALTSALLSATAHARIDVMHLLLDAGADVHAEHDRALRWACIVGRPDVVQLLLSRGADASALGGFAFQVAQLHAHSAVMAMLAAHDAAAGVAVAASGHAQHS